MSLIFTCLLQCRLTPSTLTLILRTVLLFKVNDIYSNELLSVRTSEFRWESNLVRCGFVYRFFNVINTSIGSGRVGSPLSKLVPPSVWRLCKFQSSEEIYLRLEMRSGDITFDLYYTFISESVMIRDTYQLSVYKI